MLSMPPDRRQPTPRSLSRRCRGRLSAERQVTIALQEIAPKSSRPKNGEAFARHVAKTFGQRIEAKSVAKWRLVFPSAKKI